jgi:hypothetical protein
MPAAFATATSPNEGHNKTLLNSEVYVEFSGDALLFAEAAHGLITELAPYSGDRSGFVLSLLIDILGTTIMLSREVGELSIAHFHIGASFFGRVFDILMRAEIRGRGDQPRKLLRIDQLRAWLSGLAHTATELNLAGPRDFEIHMSDMIRIAPGIANATSLPPGLAVVQPTLASWASASDARGMRARKHERRSARRPTLPATSLAAPRRAQPARAKQARSRSP